MGDNECKVNVNGSLYKEKDVFRADAEVFRIFSHTFLYGNEQNALSGPQRAVLSRSIARKYFGADAMNKSLVIDKKEYIVTGVIEDVPQNSDLKFNMLLSMDSADNSGDWFDFSYRTYFLLNKQNAGSERFIPEFEKKLLPLAEEKYNKPLKNNVQDMTITLHVQPLEGIHFSNFLLYDTPKGSVNELYIISVVAFLLLFIGCLNYVNFSIVQSIERSKEVGIRKVVGASFPQLVGRYLGESVLVTGIALAFSVVFVVAALPLFNTITGKNFSWEDLFKAEIFMAMSAILLAVGILAGSYPAFYTASIKAVTALKGSINKVKGHSFRKTSVTIQFTISIGLILCTLIVFTQMKFMKNYDLGFKANNIIVVTIPGDSLLAGKAHIYKNNILKNNSVLSASLAGWGTLPGSDPELGSVSLKAGGKVDVRMVNLTYADADYLPTMGIQLEEGRNFRSENISDKKNTILVNEALVKMMGWKNPLENKIIVSGIEKQIIGVIRNYYQGSLHNLISPQVLTSPDRGLNYLFVSFKPGTSSDLVSLLRREWKTIFSQELFDYTFVDESVNAQYTKEEKAMNLFFYFSALTIMISCLGLFGLSTLTIYQRKKEIGIRKAIGADFQSIVILFSKEYVVLIVLGILIASPLAGYIMSQWLENFVIRAKPDVWMYSATGVSIIVVSLITIILSILKISRSKPTALMGE
jgi:putative ABC transport system permease protein